MVDEAKYVVTDADKEYIRTYVAEAPDADAKKERRRECATVFGLTLPQVAAITAHTIIRAKRALTQPEVEAQAVVSAEETMPPGTAMDYNNPIKQKYRTTLEKFIERTYPNQAERKTKKVLCLPGRKLLEAHVYLDLGFVPENIVCVEGEPSAYREFLQNASQLGVSVRTCDLERVTDEQEWDVVNWDFCGPMGKKVLSLLENVRLSTKGKCVLGLNLLGQRETDASQLLIDHYYAVMQASREIADKLNISFSSALEAQNDFSSEFRLKRLEGERLTDVDISEQRDAAIPAAVLHKIASNHAPYNRTHPAPKLREEYQSNALVQKLLAALLQGLWRALSSFGMNTERAATMAHQMLLLYDVAMAPKHLCTECEQWSYISPSHQRYLADFYTVEIVRPFGVACDEIIAFINDSIVALSESEGKPAGFQVRCKKGFVYHAGHVAKNSDTLEMYVGDRVVSRVAIKSLFGGLDRFGQSAARSIVIRAVHNTYKYERKEL